MLYSVVNFLALGIVEAAQITDQVPGYTPYALKRYAVPLFDFVS
jgi:hypothetical protein